MRKSISSIRDVAKNAHWWHHYSSASQWSSNMVTTANNYANAAKKATNVSLAENLLAEAKELRINVSQAAESGVAMAVAEKRSEIWLKENAKAFECWNDYVERNGLPLAKYRSF